MMGCMLFTGSFTAFADEPVVMEYIKQTKGEEANTFTISLVGDCSIGKLQIHGYDGTFDQYYDAYGPEYFFQNVTSVFDHDDLTVANFEGDLTNSNARVEKTFNIKGRPEFVSVLSKSGIDALSFGNNHRMDYGTQGLVDTVAAFNAINMPYAYDSYTCILDTDKGVKVGIVSSSMIGGPGYGGSGHIQQGIAALRAAGADIVLACIHWGKEGIHYANADQISLGHQAIDWGADLVVGTHPHVLQGIERYKDKYIIYSLGNFCFGGNKNPAVKDTMIAQISFPLARSGNSKAAGPASAIETVGDMTLKEGQSCRIIPARLSSSPVRNDYSPVVLEGAEKQDIINKMNAYSAAFGLVFDEAGEAH